MNPDATIFRLRPRMVEARQVIAADWERCELIAAWCGVTMVGLEDWMAGDADFLFWIPTPRGDWEAVEDGDWVVKSSDRHFIRVTPDEFTAHYEPAMPRI